MAINDKIIVFNDRFGDIVRIGYYVNNKWVKWIPKKKLDSIANMGINIENQILGEW